MKINSEGYLEYDYESIDNDKHEEFIKDEEWLEEEE